MDASGSMRTPMAGGMSRLEAAKRAAASMIRSLPPDIDVGLIEFAACGQVRRDKFYPQAERDRLVGEIDALQPKAGTPLADALRRAGTIGSSSADASVVVVSDGADSCGGDPCAAARALRSRKPNIVVNVVDLSDTPRERAVLQCIAEAGGGRLLSPGDVTELTRKMKEAVAQATCR